MIADSPLNLVSYPFEDHVNEVYILIDSSERDTFPFYKRIVEELFCGVQKIKCLYYKKEDFFSGNQKQNHIRYILSQLSLIEVFRILRSEVYLNWFTNPLGNLLKYKFKCHNLYHSYTDLESLEYFMSESKVFRRYIDLCSVFKIKKIMYTLSPIEIKGEKNNVINIEIIRNQKKLNLKNHDSTIDRFRDSKNLLYLFVHKEETKYEPGGKNKYNTPREILDLNYEVILKTMKAIGDSDVTIVLKEHYRGFGLLNQSDKEYLKGKLELYNLNIIFLNEVLSEFEMFCPLELVYRYLNLTWISGEFSTFMLDDSTTDIRKIVLLDILSKYRSELLLDKIRNNIKFIDHKNLIVL